MIRQQPVYRFDIKQGSQEWCDIRAGKPTSSVAKSLFTKPRDKTQPFGVGAMEHAMRLAIERISGKPSPQNEFYAAAINRGNEYEPFAREYYELSTMMKVSEIGFVDCGTYGDSPDFLVLEDDGVGEIKCLSDPKHVMKAALGKNTDHDLQIMWHLYCCSDKKYCDFVSFYPELKKSTSIKRYYPDELQFRLFDDALDRFEAVIEEFIYKYNGSELVS